MFPQNRAAGAPFSRSLCEKWETKELTRAAKLPNRNAALECSPGRKPWEQSERDQPQRGERAVLPPGHNHSFQQSPKKIPSAPNSLEYDVGLRNPCPPPIRCKVWIRSALHEPES